MNLSPKETAQSTVRVLNDLVGEATEMIEDVLPTRNKKRSHRSMWAVIAAAVVATAVAAKLLMSKRGTTKSSASPVEDVVGSRGGSATDRATSETAASADRQRESVAASN